MNADSFARLSRRMGAAGTRRQLLRAFVLGLAATAVERFNAVPASAGLDCSQIPSQPVQCGNTCCQLGNTCVNGQCCGSVNCGSSCCPEGSGCANGQCCPLGLLCGSTCCDENSPCVDGQCCPSASICDNGLGGTCCSSNQTCLNGACCDTGLVCGSACCSSGMSCAAGVCCPSLQACGDVCCDVGETCLALQSGGPRFCCPGSRIAENQYCCDADQAYNNTPPHQPLCIGGTGGPGTCGGAAECCDVCAKQYGACVGTCALACGFSGDEDICARCLSGCNNTVQPCFKTCANGGTAEEVAGLSITPASPGRTPTATSTPRPTSTPARPDGTPPR